MPTPRIKPTNRFKPVKEVSVMVWIENQFGDVLLLKQKQGNKQWTLPGGKVNPTESLKQALKREVLEETGLKIDGIMFCHFFDRAPKETITFLYRARLKNRNDTIFPAIKEIETGKFSRSLPPSSTPSLKHFWKCMDSDRKSRL